jgi:(S)-3,5-dihydroxyphenylglycine transaminase
VIPVAEGPDGIDLDDLRAQAALAREAGLNPRACYVIPDFANPSGIRLGLDARRRLLEVAAAEDLLILEDNPYGLFGPEGDSLPTLKALDDQARVVYLGSFAKTGLPGARVGYVLADQRIAATDATDGTPAEQRAAGTLADQLAKIKSMLTVNTSPIAQAVIGGKLLTHGGSLRTANTRERAVYQRNLAHLLAGLEERFGEQDGISWNVPAGGYFLLLTVPFAASDELLELSAEEFRVLWTPVHHFYADAQPRPVMRLSFSHLMPEEIDEALNRLADFIRYCTGRHFENWQPQQD